MSARLDDNNSTTNGYRMFIDGKWCDAKAGGIIKVINPTTGEVLATTPEGRSEDIDAAVAAARRAFESGPWPEMSAADRGRILRKIGQLISEGQTELAELETRETGKIIRFTAGAEVPLAAQSFEFYGGLADKVMGETIPVAGPYLDFTLREPLGVCGLITPWNFPILLDAWKIAAALAVGNTVVLKPAEHTPLTALELARIAEEAGLPPGVLNVVPGFGPSAGATLVSHPDVDKISFTGSTATGRQIMRMAAGNLKKISLELGGKSPNIVFADADLDKAINGTLLSMFFHQGQACTAGSRLFLQNEIRETFLERLVDKVSRLRIGDPLDPATDIGPIQFRQQFDKIQRYVDSARDAGFKIHCGGGRAEGDDVSKGYFFRPTVISGAENDATICQEEIFGPVFNVLSFTDEEEAVALGNDVPYGLVAGVWSQDIGRGLRMSKRLRAGTVWLNCYNVLHPQAPFGGYKQSGMGRENGIHAIESFTQVKNVCVDLNPDYIKFFDV